MSRLTPLKGSHPVHVVHRVSAAVLGAILLAFGILGLLDRPLPLLSTEGHEVFGLSTNGALSWISILAGALLLAAAVWGGPLASTVSTAMGGVFLLSGLVHLAILHTPLNLLAFAMSNVLFSLVVGLLLLGSGLYGRLAGGLPADNPYRLAHPRMKQRPSPQEQRDAADSVPDPREEEMLKAEMAMGEGSATREQERLVREEQATRRQAERERAYRNAAKHNRERQAGKNTPNR